MKSLFTIAAVALLAPSAPFPAPKLTGVTPETKCDWGPITEVKSGNDLLVVKTDAGPFEVRLTSDVKVAGPDGKPLRSAAELRAGQNIRVYYRVENKPEKGAMAQEIDVIQ
jgi:hypothetical protein